MERTPAQQTTTATGPRMVFTMGGIGLFCGILIVLTYQMTLPIIRVNKARALDRAIFEVVPRAATKSTFKLDGERLVPVSADDPSELKYYACYDDTEELVGVAVEASGQGFQDLLRIIYGYSPAKRCVVGMKVLESKETPGLGDKIEKDPEFRANFEALEVELDAGGNTIAHPIELAKKGEKESAWQVEAITGATISSRAIASILEKSTAKTVPVIMGNLDVLREGAPGGTNNDG